MTRVLIADDSSFMRKSLTFILRSDPSIEVVGAAPDGVEALRQTKELRPDVVLMDIEMPRMDGLTALDRIMAECPTPVVMLSGLDPSITVRSLEHGAVDFLAKPSGVISYDIEKIGGEIIAKVKIAAEVDVQKLKLRFPPETCPPRPRGATARKVVVIGASTGGPRAILAVLSRLPHDIPTAILVVQHMGAAFLPSFAERLRANCPLDVSLAQDGATICSGQVRVAPCGFRTSIAPEAETRKIRLTPEAPRGFASPSIDHAMESAALAYGKDAVGVLLTGMGNDGAQGMKSIKDAGGGTIAEDQSTCVVFGMPKAAIELGCVDRVVPLPQVAPAILMMVMG